MTDYDVLVVGGGAAGLGAALALGRARRKVLVVDAGQPRNAPAEGVHGFFTRDGTPPGELVELGRAEVRRYGVEVVEGRVHSIAPGFTASLADGSTARARAVLVTTGLVDELPEIDGLRERWGRDVLHCPYCHGYEVQDRALGVVATGPMAVHQALLIRQWSDDVTLFLHDTVEPTDDEWERLAARGVSVVTGKVEQVVVTDDRLTGVRLADGTVVARDALFTAGFLRASSDVLTSLGVEIADMEIGGAVIGTRVVADATGRTSVPGVWAAGNVADPMAQVVSAAAAGNWAGAQINADLVVQETDAAVRARAGARLEREVSEIVLGDRRHGLEPAPRS